MAGVGEWSGEMEDLGQLLDLFDGPSGGGGGGDAAMPLKYDSPGSDGGSEAAAYAGPGGSSEGDAERKEETDQVLMDMSPMASSGSAPPAPYNKERKRYREKQRRLEVNDKFASLAKCVGAHRKIDRSELLQLVIDKFKDLDRENKELKEKLNGVSAAAHYYPQMAQMPQVAQVPQMPQPQMEDRAVKKAKLSHDQSAMQYGSMFGFPAYVPGAGACLIPPKPYFALMMQQNMAATPTSGFSIDEESEITHSHCA